MSAPRATEVSTISTESLGDRSYVIDDGEVAIAFDVQRDIDRVEMILAERSVRLLQVLETHIHNDYVSGGLELARRHGAEYVIPTGTQSSYEHTARSGGDSWAAGSLLVKAVATPGHTPNHLSYVVRDDAGDSYLFSGGSMLYGAVGRPDLVAPELTVDLANAQWRSVRSLAAGNPSATHLLPTHGFGSFCAATQNEGESGTVGDEHRHNPALTQDQATFVRSTLDALDVFPSYYAHMAPTNEVGPAPVDLSRPERLTAEQLLDEVDAGGWVVDIRPRESFAKEHMRGTLSFGLDGAMATYLGWTMPWGARLTLLADSDDDIARAQRELIRIGVDRPMAAVWSDLEKDQSLPVADLSRVGFESLASQLSQGEEFVLLDTRQVLEYEQGHLAGAMHIPFYELPARLDEIPAGRSVAVYCGTGYRAAFAVSYLRRSRPELHIIHVDDAWTAAGETALSIVAVDNAPARQPGWTWSISRRNARVAATSHATVDSAA